MCKSLVLFLIAALVLTLSTTQSLQIFVQSFAQQVCDPNTQSCLEPAPQSGCDPNTQSCLPPEPSCNPLTQICSEPSCDPNTQSCLEPSTEPACDPTTQDCPEPAPQSGCDPGQACDLRDVHPFDPSQLPPKSSYESSKYNCDGFGSPSLKFGSTGEKVKELQTYLVDLGYAKFIEPPGFGGVFGPHTMDAVILWQKNMAPSLGISPNGEVGPLTWYWMCFNVKKDLQETSLKEIEDYLAQKP